MPFTLSKKMKLFEFDEEVDIPDLKRKAQAGDEIAQSNLAALSIKGKGVDQDVVKACYWFRLATEQGVVSAQYNLGVAYQSGEGWNRIL